ncbi:MAG: hypothetical protein KDA55_23730, partial [Planctomycetales bacterium]|nr:hypothetical protein [Planctomycetales bacterium]
MPASSLECRPDGCESVKVIPKRQIIRSDKGLIGRDDWLRYKKQEFPQMVEERFCPLLQDQSLYGHHHDLLHEWGRIVPITILVETLWIGALICLSV